MSRREPKHSQYGRGRGDGFKDRRAPGAFSRHDDRRQSFGFGDFRSRVDEDSNWRQRPNPPKTSSPKKSSGYRDAVSARSRRYSDFDFNPRSMQEEFPPLHSEERSGDHQAGSRRLTLTGAEGRESFGFQRQLPQSSRGGRQERRDSYVGGDSGASGSFTTTSAAAYDKHEDWDAERMKQSGNKDDVHMGVETSTDKSKGRDESGHQTSQYPDTCIKEDIRADISEHTMDMSQKENQTNPPRVYEKSHASCQTGKELHKGRNFRLKELSDIIYEKIIEASFPPVLKSYPEVRITDVDFHNQINKNEEKPISNRDIIRQLKEIKYNFRKTERESEGYESKTDSKPTDSDNQRTEGSSYGSEAFACSTGRDGQDKSQRTSEASTTEWEAESSDVSGNWKMDYDESFSEGQYWDTQPGGATTHEDISSETQKGQSDNSGATRTTNEPNVRGAHVPGVAMHNLDTSLVTRLEEIEERELGEDTRPESEQNTTSELVRQQLNNLYQQLQKSMYQTVAVEGSPDHQMATAMDPSDYEEVPEEGATAYPDPSEYDEYSVEEGATAYPSHRHYREQPPLEGATAYPHSDYEQIPEEDATACPETSDDPEHPPEEGATACPESGDDPEHPPEEGATACSHPPKKKLIFCYPTDGDYSITRRACRCLGNSMNSVYLLQRIAITRASDDEDINEDDGVLPDPDSVIKHPLQNSWAMWFFKNDKSRDWKDNLRVITTFDTVEDFWGLYNHTLPASKLQTGCDYSVFKAGIQPMWEDPQNKKGGRWLINLNKSQRQTHLDDFWLETLLCLIGEGFDENSEDICGAVVNIRTKGDKLGLWTRDASKTDATKKIGLKLKESLNVPPKIIIGFQAHSDTAGKAGSTVKNRFTV